MLKKYGNGLSLIRNQTRQSIGNYHDYDDNDGTINFIHISVIVKLPVSLYDEYFVRSNSNNQLMKNQVKPIKKQCL